MVALMRVSISLFRAFKGKSLLLLVSIFGALMMPIEVIGGDHPASHGAGADEFDLEKRQEELKAMDDSAFYGMTKDEALNHLEELHGSELGRFLLENRGLDGQWTAYLIKDGLEKSASNATETWLLNKAPAVLATRERFGIFQKQLKKYLKAGMSIASVPCGRMDDLIDLNIGDASGLTFTGIDLDQGSLDLAREKSDSVSGKENTVSFRYENRNALSPDIGMGLGEDRFDIITSNGLNIYLEDIKVDLLYQNFYKALKPGGLLITSFLTPKEDKNGTPIWEVGDVQENLKKQRTIFVTILGVRWQNLRTEEETKDQLKKAGFEAKTIEFKYDKRKIFPTVIARKPVG